ncbi:MAG TPA: sialidase family protein [Chthonomonadaceae bacterium]|nr:sialidase family protein [Chthonomonadaceae bacterium]
MYRINTRVAILVVAFCLAGAATGRAVPHADSDAVSFWKLPAGAIQPQAVVDARGVAHVIYFVQGGVDGVGDLYYVRRAPGERETSKPIRVNSVRDSAGSIGTVRTAQIAVGRPGHVFVVWNGLGPKAPNGFPVAYEAYARLNSAGTAFEPQRDLITWAKGLDGGGSVAADREGRVYVAWHALAGAKDEAGRAVYVSRSDDDGETFAREVRAISDPTGACGCCGMKAMVDSRGALYLLYRTATNRTERDTALLVSTDQGRTFRLRRIDPWHIDTCPMSTYSMAPGPAGVTASWETAGHVRTASVRPDSLAVSAFRETPGAGQKHPFVAVAPDGRTLIVWTEGTGWQRGGALAWQIVSTDGKIETGGRKDGAIPVWGLATAYAGPDSRFTILY